MSRYDEDPRRIRWDKESQRFVGGARWFQEQMTKLGYWNEFGSEWVWAVLKDMTTWARITEYKGRPRIECYRNYERFVLNWFRKSANGERKKSSPDDFMAFWERERANEKPVACKRDHARERVRGSELWYCPDACGWTERLPEGMRRKSGV